MSDFAESYIGLKTKRWRCKKSNQKDQTYYSKVKDSTCMTYPQEHVRKKFKIAQHRWLSIAYLPRQIYVRVVKGLEFSLKEREIQRNQDI